MERQDDAFEISPGAALKWSRLAVEQRRDLVFAFFAGVLGRTARIRNLPACFHGGAILRRYVVKVPEATFGVAIYRGRLILLDIAVYTANVPGGLGPHAG